MKQLLLLTVVCALAELTSGCSLIVGNKLDDYEFADGGVRDGSADGGPSDAGGDSATWDGGVYDDAAQDAARDTGDGCDLHTDRFVHERGTTCAAGTGAGLARRADDPSSEIGTTAVSACVTLGTNGSGTLAFDAHHVTDVCGDGCGEDYCGEPMTLFVFAVDADGNTTRVLARELSAAPAQYAVNIRSEYTELLLCRGGGGPGRDNIVIERLRAC